MTESSQHTAQNRRAWNEIAGIRERSFPPAAFFAAGNGVLDPRVLAAVGSVAGLSLLHLQCATGEETLSWAVRGAHAIGVDISDAQIALAHQKAHDAAVPVTFLAGDIYALPDQLQAATFDCVYTGGGALMWLPDITHWAQIVARALRPGGRLVLFELHPVALCLWATNAQLAVVDNYFRRDAPAFEQGWSHFPGGAAAQETKVQFAWPLGDIITALISAGLQIEWVREYPSEEAYRFGSAEQAMQQLPGLYLLTARRV